MATPREDLIKMKKEATKLREKLFKMQKGAAADKVREAFLAIKKEVHILEQRVAHVDRMASRANRGARMDAEPGSLG